MDGINLGKAGGGPDFDNLGANMGGGAGGDEEAFRDTSEMDGDVDEKMEL